MASRCCNPAVIIPKEKLTSFKRWQLASFDRPSEAVPPEDIPPATEPPEPEAPPPCVEEEPAPPPPPSAEEIQQLYEETRSNAQSQGHAEGYAAGYAEGQAAAKQAQEASAAAQGEHFAALLQNLRQALAVLEQEVADELLEMALVVAGQVLRTTIAVDKEALLPTIREAIASLPGHHPHLQVHLHPDDAAVLRPLIDEQLSQTGGHVVDNPEISPGGCRITSTAGEIDASIETRWRRVLEAIGTEPQAWLKT